TAKMIFPTKMTPSPNFRAAGYRVSLRKDTTFLMPPPLNHSARLRIPLYSITDWHRSPISDSHPFDQPGT
ncbi:hypothetical protein, partial [Escherichia coli]|uniref:hypothetical protein n=1 Tax=Escherichia coli TaxID=562 RepID=UPI001BDB8E62